MGIIKHCLYQVSSQYWLSFFKKQSIFPYYHIVKDSKVAHIENLYPYKNQTQFISDLEFLLKHYKPINPEMLQTDRSIKNTFLLSFDDGLSEIYTDIFPILKARNVKAIFFINPCFVDNTEALYKHSISIVISHLKKNNFKKEDVEAINTILLLPTLSNEALEMKLKATPFSSRAKINEVLTQLNINIDHYLSSERPYISKLQIQEMMDAGFYFGGHTMSHPPLNQLSHADQKAQIIDSIEWLKSNFGIQYSYFAFPFSDKGISSKLIQELFEYDQQLLIFGNSGLKKDIDSRIIQRFSLENPNRKPGKVIISENLYKIYNKLIGKYNIHRK